ncbi:papain-like cysteine protease family protein [Ramlibacter tataouinensis]|uniref:papain-like cysteine protease family protein n=1 Tax=Ramlibacter tataouinensis TaxID=94132 RepID=UPI0022F3C106|nr:papain-like cysteine protease family protein [Ramlibacter tataouinensis]WBY01779.1 papain-like cysteine protease family protein [Ramlibacter tataouinensis]
MEGRRAVAMAALLAGWLSWGAPAAAATRCEPTAQAGVERCVSGLPAATLKAMAQAQRASQWCWAASISMVLRAWGVDVPQEQIVRQHYGAAADLGVEGPVIDELLSRTWHDRLGRSVSVSAGALPPSASRMTLAAPEIVDDLDNERPAVLVLPRHAVVLVQLEYERSASGEVTVLDAQVLDPAQPQVLRRLRPQADIVHLTRVVEASAADPEDPARVAAQQ